MKGQLLIEHKNTAPIKDDFESADFDDLTASFLEPKGGTKIDEELEKYRSASSSEKEEIDSKVEVESFEDDLDSLGDSEDEENLGSNKNENKDSEEEEEVGEIEDFFESAEFLIWILELAIVWGTNFYLKRQELDTIGVEEFERTKAQQKRFVKSVSKVLMKNNAKISPELELLFHIGANYVMQIGAIVKRQKLRKELKIKNTLVKAKVIKKQTTKNEAKDFREVEEVLEEVKQVNNEELTKTVVVEEEEKEENGETRKQFRERIRKENKEKREKEKEAKFKLNGIITE
jgi:hypothetical protein